MIEPITDFSPLLPVRYDDVIAARQRIGTILRPTPLFEWPGLSKLLGFRLLLKHENHQPVGAFKVRGGVNLVSCLSADERARGIVGCSTGNHGQSLAFAARKFGVHCTIVVPVGNNPDKTRAIQLLGAELIEQGADFDEAKAYVENTLAPTGLRYVHSANEPLLIAGVGTMALEIFEEVEKPTAVLVPIGLGSGVCGTAIVAKSVSPSTKVIGVQAENAPAVMRSWQSGRMESTERAATWAEGLATRAPASLTMDIMTRLMDDALLVGEEDLRRSCHTLLRETHQLVEGAGAATVAAAWKLREQYQGETVVAVVSGGNLDLRELPKILEAGPLR